MAVKTNNTTDKLKQKAVKIGEGSGSPDSSLPQKQEEQKGGMMMLLESMKPEIEKALPETMKSDRMIRLALTAFKANSSLKKADPYSFIAAVMQSAQLGLEPNTSMGEAYIIPRFNSQLGKMEATFQIGYRGILSLAHRTGKYQSIYSEPVYENDRFEYELGLHKKLVHVPADIPNGEPTYYYAVYHLVNGGFDFKVWSRAKVKLHASRFSTALQKNMSTPWKTNFDSMAMKTVLLDCLKYAPKSIEFSQQLSLDNTVKKNVESEPERIIVDMEDTSERSEPDEFYDFGEEPPVTEFGY